ncbi:MAG: site-specific DNA-methyltransferase [Clostridiaceae bacterium]
MRVFCTTEQHANGGPGEFILARTEDALKDLLASYRNRVQVIYLDPPFGTGDVFHSKVGSGHARLSLPIYADTMEESAYLDWMRTVLSGARELLSETGSLYLHIDYRMSAKLRLMLDEIFGEQNFMNEIVWCYKSGGRATRYYPRKHDTILFYRKSAKVLFDISAVGRPRGPEKRNHMRRFIDEDGRICFTIRSAGKIYTYYEDTPVFPSDVWDDIEHLQQKDSERVGYATQKPEALLNRVILASSRPGDLVCDLFSGSGTTAAAASKLGRRFLAVDASPISLYTLRARQLKAASAHSLLEGENALILRYPLDETPAQITSQIVTQRGKRMLQIEQASFSPVYPLVYAAAGTMRDGVFTPVSTDCRPKLPLSLPIGDIQSPIAQISDAMGHTAFFEIES